MIKKILIFLILIFAIQTANANYTGSFTHTKNNVTVTSNEYFGCPACWSQTTDVVNITIGQNLINHKITSIWVNGNATAPTFGKYTLKTGDIANSSSCKGYIGSVEVAYAICGFYQDAEVFGETIYIVNINYNSNINDYTGVQYIKFVPTAWSWLNKIERTAHGGGNVPNSVNNFGIGYINTNGINLFPTDDIYFEERESLYHSYIYDTTYDLFYINKNNQYSKTRLKSNVFDIIEDSFSKNNTVSYFNQDDGLEFFITWQDGFTQSQVIFNPNIIEQPFIGNFQTDKSNYYLQENINLTFNSSHDFWIDLYNNQDGFNYLSYKFDKNTNKYALIYIPETLQTGNYKLKMRYIKGQTTYETNIYKNIQILNNSGYDIYFNDNNVLVYYNDGSYKFGISAYINNSNGYFVLKNPDNVILYNQSLTQSEFLFTEIPITPNYKTGYYKVYLYNQTGLLLSDTAQVKYKAPSITPTPIPTGTPTPTPIPTINQEKDGIIGMGSIFFDLIFGKTTITDNQQQNEIEMQNLGFRTLKTILLMAFLIICVSVYRFVRR